MAPCRGQLGGTAPAGRLPTAKGSGIVSGTYHREISESSGTGDPHRARPFCRDYAAEVEKIKEDARRRQIEGGKTAGKGR
ncbi:hypothetical protein THTE_1750 [Thermogutta terrifontis]|uniref:Uncharacterized protein n=1 Tax=Thermogutta terrifontis TaxID=1331910 RepID=A0A286REH8_9BACT|nr:hypothetical protein [Thermogutta terrifontis]ASV74352.1 hypothetical protein THTE_1750 [Thermogutta terrifontis]